MITCMLCLIKHANDFFSSRVKWLGVFFMHGKKKNNQGKTERLKLVELNWQVNVPKCLHKTMYILM